MITTTIMNYFAQGVLFILSFIIYVFIVGKLLPVIFLRPRYKGLKSNDRGLKRYTYENGSFTIDLSALEAGRYTMIVAAETDAGDYIFKHIFFTSFYIFFN